MAASAINPYGPPKPQAPQASASGPYRGGLQTSGFANARYSNDPDADVRGLQEVEFLKNQGVGSIIGGFNERATAMADMYRSRINQKNALAEQIATAEGRGKKNALTDVYGEATRALGQGLKKTGENYNSRGLLYSGMREGAQEKVKAGVGAKLSSDIASTNREMANVAAKAKAAYASIGLQNQQQNVELANLAFETASRNNIARLQAYQQFWGGLGGAAGTVMGSMSSPSSSPSTVNGNYRPDQGGVAGKPGLLGEVA